MPLQARRPHRLPFRALRVTWTRGPETRGTPDAGLGLVVNLNSRDDRAVGVCGSRCGTLRVA
jgi:hypothetical protein